MARQISNEEIATILGALRYFQIERQRFATIQESAGPRFRENCEHFQDFAPLADDRIDALCEELNFKDTFVVDGDLKAGSLRSVDDIQIKLAALQQRVTDDEPEEYNDRDEEQEWYGVGCEIDALQWVLGTGGRE